MIEYNDTAMLVCVERARLEHAISQCVSNSPSNSIASNCSPGQMDYYVIAPVIQTAAIITDETNTTYQNMLLRELAEFSEDNACLGQVNLLPVSSFCGPQGIIFGYDVLKVELMSAFGNDSNGVLDDGFTITNMDPILMACKIYFGTSKILGRQFEPGSFLNAVFRHCFAVGPKYIIASLAIIIPRNRQRQACLIIEDIHIEDCNSSVIEMESLRLHHQQLFIECCLMSANTQGISIKEILVSTVIKVVPLNSTAVIQIVVPYFKLPQNVCRHDQSAKDLIDLPFNALSY